VAQHEIAEFDVSDLGDGQRSAVSHLLGSSDIAHEWLGDTLRVPLAAEGDASEILEWARAGPDDTPDGPEDSVREVPVHPALARASKVVAVAKWLCAAGLLLAVITFAVATARTAEVEAWADLDDLGISEQIRALPLAQGPHGEALIDAVRVDVRTTTGKGRFVAFPIHVGPILALGVATRAWFLLHRVLRRLQRSGNGLTGSGDDLRELSLWVGAGVPLAAAAGGLMRAVALSKLSVGIDVTADIPMTLGSTWPVWIVIGVVIRGLAPLADARSTEALSDAPSGP
jgi:hypothetical protein